MALWTVQKFMLVDVGQKRNEIEGYLSMQANSNDVSWKILIFSLSPFIYQFVLSPLG